MYKWRLDLLFKYSGNNLTRWRKIVGSQVQNNDGKWGFVTYISGSSNTILDIDSKDVYIYLGNKKLQFSWQEFFYDFKDIQLNFDLLSDLYQYFINEDNYKQSNKDLYSLLQEEYFKQQNIIDNLIIENIRSERYNSDDEFFNQNLENLEKLEKTFENEFLNVDNIYQYKYASFLTQQDYHQRKKSFIQLWIQNNKLGNKSDLDQSLAIGSVNSHVQLIARAGSGNTSTLVNRAIFLQKHCGIKPSEILLLAFNRKAAQEIRERLQKYLQNDLPYSMTFHALAYHLVHPEETLIFDEPDDQQTKSRSLQSVIDEYIRNPDYSEQIKSLMIAKFRKIWIRISEGGYDLTPEEMIEYRRSLPQVGIDGNNYKSGGEKIIADFLFEHDIPFKYEKNFWWNSINYHPDFTILKEVNGKKGIVIEYFGLQGDPNYDEQSEQKRRYWKEDQFDYFFIELNPAILKQHGREGMENHLQELLTDLGLEFSLLSIPEIWERIKERAIDDFTKSMTQFIGRCRKQCLTPDQLSEKIERYFATNPQTSEPEFQFLDLAQNFYISYLDRLQQTGEEDFDGLMHRAA